MGFFDPFWHSDRFTSKEEAARRREELEKQKDELRAIEEVAVDLGAQFDVNQKGQKDPGG